LLPDPRHGSRPHRHSPLKPLQFNRVTAISYPNFPANNVAYPARIEACVGLLQRPRNRLPPTAFQVALNTGVAFLAAQPWNGALQVPIP
jgi:hypothetical protein